MYTYNQHGVHPSIDFLPMAIIIMLYLFIAIELFELKRLGIYFTTFFNYDIWYTYQPSYLQQKHRILSVVNGLLTSIPTLNFKCIYATHLSNTYPRNDNNVAHGERPNLKITVDSKEHGLFLKKMCGNNNNHLST
jgi:hypothetical protein